MGNRQLNDTDRVLRTLSCPRTPAWSAAKRHHGDGPVVDSPTLGSSVFTVRTRVTAILFVAVVVLIAPLLSSCTLGAEDVPFTVTVVNDTPDTVVDHVFFSANAETKDASSNGKIVKVATGHSFGEAEYPDLGVDPDRLTDVGGETLGCLPFKFSHKPPTPVSVEVTQMVMCHHWSQYGSVRKDWPNRNY